MNQKVWEIFDEGFQLRSADPDVDPVYRNATDTSEVGDISPSTAICVTTDFYTGPFFPNTNLMDTWVYCVYVEKGYNTKRRQVKHGLGIIDTKTLHSDAQPDEGPFLPKRESGTGVQKYT